MEVTPAMEAGDWARRLGSLQTEVGGATRAMSGMGGGAGLASRAPATSYLARRSFIHCEFDVFSSLSSKLLGHNLVRASLSKTCREWWWRRLLCGGW